MRSRRRCGREKRTRRPSAPRPARSVRAAMAMRQTPLTCSGHTRPVVDLAFSGITPYGYFLISACKGERGPRSGFPESPWGGGGRRRGAGGPAAGAWSGSSPTKASPFTFIAISGEVGLSIPFRGLGNGENGPDSAIPYFITKTRPSHYLLGWDVPLCH